MMTEQKVNHEADLQPTMSVADLIRTVYLFLEALPDDRRPPKLEAEVQRHLWRINKAEQTPEQAYDDGREAFKSGQPEGACPFLEADPLWQSWMAGWSDGKFYQKMQEDLDWLIAEYNRQMDAAQSETD